MIGHGNGAGEAIFGGTGTYLAHGVTQGLLTQVQGGQFGAGFASGIMGHAAGGVMSNVRGGLLARTGVAAVLGGMSSSALGGGFAQGAKSASMVHLFNAEAYRRAAVGIREKARVRFEERMQKMWEAGYAGDGHTLHPNETFWWWKNGKGKTLTVDASVLQLYEIWFTGVTVVGPNIQDVMVHGQGTPNGNGGIKDGPYDFNPQAFSFNPAKAARNILNAVARERHGEGDIFQIVYQ